MIFWLGCHQPGWLANKGVPLFVSRVRLAPYKRLPKAVAPWALDSGAFSEIAAHGRWTIGPEQYAEEVERFQTIGGMAWAAPQDWMCEREMLEKTGLSVEEHQRRTVMNYLELRRIAPGLPFIPVLQGYTFEDYMRCLAMYTRAGVDLRRKPLVGLGSVCKRGATDFVADLCRELHGLGVRLHAFGLKIEGLSKCAQWLTSADSLAWSDAGRRVKPCPRRGVVSCANCWHFARRWHGKVIRAVRRGHKPKNPSLFAGPVPRPGEE